MGNRALGDRDREETGRQKGLDWMEERLDDAVLDVEALEAMPLRDVNARLRKLGAADQEVFLAALKARLPEGMALEQPTAPIPATAGRQDRAARAPSAPRRRTPWFSMRGALVLSILIVLGAALGPLTFRLVREARQERAAALQADRDLVEEESPTWLEIPEHELGRPGASYRIEGLDRVPIDMPLPQIPRSVEATYRLRIVVAPAGEVAELESLLETPPPYEAVVIDSVLQWRFAPLPAGVPREHRSGIVTIRFEAR